MELRQADYTPDELSKLVCYEILRLAGQSAEIGWADIEETLRHVFSDEVVVEDDGTVRRVSEADSA